MKNETERLNGLDLAHDCAQALDHFLLIAGRYFSGVNTQDEAIKGVGRVLKRLTDTRDLLGWSVSESERELVKVVVDRAATTEALIRLLTPGKRDA